MISREFILEKANRFIYYDLGQCFKVSRIEYDEANKMWYAFVSYSYPTVIDDPANEERFVKSIIFNDLFEISFNSRGKIIYKPSPQDLEERITINLAQDLRRLGEVLMDITSEQLVKIPTIRNAMIPFERIFIEIEDGEDQKLTPYTIKRLKKINKKINLYLGILEALSLIRRYSNTKGELGYVKGNSYIEIDHMNPDSERKRDILLAYVLKHGYSLIMENVRLYAIVPFVRYQEVYYYSTYKIGDIVHFDENEFIRKTMEFYGTKPNKTKMKSQLDWLIKADILERESDYYIGNENIYQKLRKSLAY